MKPVAMAASVSSLRVLQGECVSSGVTNNIDYSFLPFIREGVVSHAGCDIKVPIWILRDTAACDSYILDSVLPFSEKTDTGHKTLMRGMGMSVLPVPVHQMNLDCELVQGQVHIGGQANITSRWY